MTTIFDWLRNVLTVATAKSSPPPWKFPPLADEGEQRFPPLDDGGGPRFPPLDDGGDRQCSPLDDLPADDPYLHPPQHWLRHGIRPEHEIAALLDPATPGNLWRAVAGQDAVKRQLSRIAGHALRRISHRCDQNFILAGASPADRTALARVFANDVLMLPFVPLDASFLAPQKVPLAHILLAIGKSLMTWSKDWIARGGVDEDGLGLTLVEIDDEEYYPPPLVVFIDDAAKLPKTVQNAIFKATDPADDRVIVSELGHTIRCSRICWVLGVTDATCLPATFASRFEVVAMGNEKSRVETT